MGLSCKSIRLKERIVFLCIVFIPFITSYPVTGMGEMKSVRTNNPTQEEAPKIEIMNLFGKAIGLVDTDGDIMNLYGRSVGSINKDGEIFNVSKIFIGKVETDGKIYNQSGTVLGSVDTEGNVFNVSGHKVGEVRNTNDIHLIGGAARLLLLKTRRVKPTPF